MREIKFRAWDGKRMHYEGFGVTCSGIPTIGYVSHQISPENKEALTIMQFSGIKDKNEKEIYEGDLLGNGHFVSEVFFDSDKAAFCWRSKNNSSTLSFYNSVNLGFFEIIGNIYQNLELLK